MWNQLWIPILIPTLIIKSNCDNNSTDSDVIVRYGGHADAEYQYPTTTTTNKTTVTDTTTTIIVTTTKTTEISSTDKFDDEKDDDVVFVPNMAPPETREEPGYDQGLRVKDIMMIKSANDAMNKDFHVEKNDDTPNADIVFISGKNHGHDKEISEENTRRRSVKNKNENQKKSKTEDTTEIPELNCRDLDCNNTVNSVCGTKLMNNELRHRLFLNDCFFRKVNCAFKYAINRYKQVPVTQCKRIGSHYVKRPPLFNNKPAIYKPILKSDTDARRSSSSRRAMSKNINGEFCSHSCPLTCSEDYDPECAISNTGQRRVFLNHCKLDYNSCFYSVVWHKRPLAECVGGKKADMRQNRGFIGWMQRVGIVDKKGRLVLE